MAAEDDILESRTAAVEDYVEAEVPSVGELYAPESEAVAQPGQEIDGDMAQGMEESIDSAPAADSEGRAEGSPISVFEETLFSEEPAAGDFEKKTGDGSLSWISKTENRPLSFRYFLWFICCGENGFDDRIRL